MMDKYITYILFSIVVLLCVVIIIKLFARKKEDDSSFSASEKRILDDNERIKKGIIDIKQDLSNSLNRQFLDINEQMNRKLLEISEKVNQNVKDNFSQTNTTFNELKEKITLIEKAQQDLSKVEESVNDFRNVLENKKSRGGFGEVQLETLLYDAFGDRPEIVKRQYSLKPGLVVDCALFLPDPIGVLSIDSKFPLENYKKIYDKSISPVEKEIAVKQFRQDIIKHITDIESKYIIAGVTTNQAVMFIPSEAVFAEINSNYPDVVKQAQKSRVWITSPTTLMCLLETLVILIRNNEMNKNAEKIKEDLASLAKLFKNYQDRWDAFEKNYIKTLDEVKDIRVTTKKISTKFVNLAVGKTDEPLEEIEVSDEKDFD